VLGIGLALAPLGAFLAVSEKFELLPVLLGFIVLLWVSGFDIIYALQDEEFDHQNKLHSVPSLLGKQKALWVSNFLHLLCAVLLLYTAYLGDFGGWYWAGAFIFVGLLIYQHRLVSYDDLSKVNLAFFTTNGVASVIFAAFVLLELFV